MCITDGKHTSLGIYVWGNMILRETRITMTTALSSPAVATTYLSASHMHIETDIVPFCHKSTQK